MILSQWHGQVEHNLRFSLQSSLNIFISFFHDFFVLPFSRLMLYSSKQQYGWYRCNQEYVDMYSVCNCLHAEYCLSYNLKYIHTWTIFYPKIILRKALNLSQVQWYHWLFRIQRSRLNKYYAKGIDQTLYRFTGEITTWNVERKHGKFVNHSPQACELDISSFTPNTLCGL